MSDGERVVPKINDAFWFEYSEDLVTSAQENRAKAAEKIRDLVKWLWPLYTTGTAIGLGLADKVLPFWEKILIAAGGASLILVYWSTTYIELPRLVSFDPRSPTEIQAAYEEVIRAKQKWLRISVALSVLAGFLVTLALVIASVNSEEKPRPLELRTAVHTVENAPMLSVTARVGKTDKVLLVIQPAKAAESGGDPETLVLAPAPDGVVYGSVPLYKKTFPLDISLEWKGEDGTAMRVSKEIKQ